MVPQLVKKFHNFLESEDLLSYSQDHATGRYVESDASNLHPHILLKI